MTGNTKGTEERSQGTPSKTAAHQRGRPFRVGRSGNPKGRPKRGTSLAEVCRKHRDLAVGVILQVAQDSRQHGRERLRAAEMLLQYGYGPPRPPIDLDGAFKVESLADLAMLGEKASPLTWAEIVASAARQRADPQPSTRELLMSRFEKLARDGDEPDETTRSGSAERG